MLVFPEAFGLDAHAVSRAERLAALGYVAIACDLHGEGWVIDDLQEAMTQLQPLFEDPARSRARALGALLALAARPEVDKTRIAAIGFCFPMPLELARSGAEIKAAIDFHTSLRTKAPGTEPGAIKARMLVCIGADDPFIPATRRAEFESEMRNTNTDWQMNVYGGTVHSVTNNEASKRNMPEAIRYNPEADARAWASALDLFARALG